MSTRRIVALVVGCVLILPAIGVLSAGGALAVGYATQRGDDGYFDVTINQLQTPTAAITGEDVKFTTDPGSPDWLVDAIDLDVRLRATALDPEREIFIGIARQSDLDRYLADVAHDRVSRVVGTAPVYRRQGTELSAVAEPAEQDIWVASAGGSGTQELTWSATSGRWAAVVMNADGSPGITASMTIGATSGLIAPLAVVLTTLGVALTAAAVVLIVYGAAGARRRPDRDGNSDGVVVASDAPQPGDPLPPPETSVAEADSQRIEVPR
jgi:hypothetical protein